MTNTKPTSLRLSTNYLNEINKIADLEGVKKSVILIRAIKEYIENYNKPKKLTEESPQRINTFDKNIRMLSSRINILSRQVDNTQKRVLNLEKSKNGNNGN